MVLAREGRQKQSPLALSNGLSNPLAMALTAASFLLRLDSPFDLA